jgi:hypothetical protein
MRMYVQIRWADVGNGEEVNRVLQAEQDAVNKLQAQVGDAGLSGTRCLQHHHAAYNCVDMTHTDRPRYR